MHAVAPAPERVLVAEPGWQVAQYWPAGAVVAQKLGAHWSQLDAPLLAEAVPYPAATLPHAWQAAVATTE